MMRAIGEMNIQTPRRTTTTTTASPNAQCERLSSQWILVNIYIWLKYFIYIESKIETCFFIFYFLHTHTDDLSSDDDERGACGRQNGFVYTIDPEGLGIGEYGADVDRYGKAYARYKSRIVKKNRITLGGDDDDDADGVSDDDDDRNGRSVNSSSTCLDDDYYSD